MEQKKPISKTVIIISAVVLILFLGLIGSATLKQDKANTLPSPTPVPVKQLNMSVNNLMVKKINMDQCRYFFNVKNDEDSDFKGEVHLALHKLNSVWPDSSGAWDVDAKAHFGQPFYFDSELCPNSIQKGGAATFSWEVKKGDNTVAQKDDATITSEFEDLTN